MSTGSNGGSIPSISELPDKLRQAVDRFCDLPLASKPALEAEIEKYADDIEKAACYYFVESDDQDGDLESVYGFDDDAEVLNEILELLNRPDLTVQI